MNRLVEVRGLYKSFGMGQRRVDVLIGLDLDVSLGEMLAITGASGSGKSTLLHLVGAMEHPDRGEIHFGGTNLSRLDKPGLARFRNREIGFVFQSHHLLPEFTALENVMMPLLLRGEARRKAEASAQGLLEEVGLADRVMHRPGELSGGEQQRVAVARALAGSPRLLLADEPTGNLDDRTSQSIHELLRNLHDKTGLTSIVITHDPSLAALCGRELRMEGGHLYPVRGV